MLLRRAAGQNHCENDRASGDELASDDSGGNFFDETILIVRAPTDQEERMCRRATELYGKDP